jgi:hypothetical protein
MPLRRTAKTGGTKTQTYFDFSQYGITTPTSTSVAPIIPYPPSASITLLPDGSIVTHTIACGTDCTTCLYAKMQDIILRIIQYVTDQLALEPLLTELLELRGEITTQREADMALQRIENMILSIIDNITNRTNLNVILGRIDFLRNQLTIAGDTSSIYTEIYEMIINIIDQVGSQGALEPVLETIQSLRDTIIPDVAVANYISDIESIILSIVDNITNRVNLGVVLGRFVLLERKLAELIAVTATGA